MTQLSEDVAERIKRVDQEYWDSFRENRAPVIGPSDLRAVLDAAIAAYEAKGIFVVAAIRASIRRKKGKNNGSKHEQH